MCGGGAAKGPEGVTDGGGACGGGAAAATAGGGGERGVALALLGPLL